MIAFQSFASAFAVLSLMPSALLAGPNHVSDLQIRIVDAQQLPVEGVDLFVTDSAGTAILGVLDAASLSTTLAWGDAVTIDLPALGKTFDVPLSGAAGTAITLQVGRSKDVAAVTSVKPFQIHPTTAALGGGPVNDDCGDAIPIADGDTGFSTVGATTDGALGTNNNEIWYTYTASCSGVATFSTCNQADFDTDLLLLTDDSCAGQTLLALNDDGAGCAGFTSVLTAPVSAGQTYLLSVGGFGDGDVGTGTLSVSCTASAANDECESAEAIAIGGSVTFDNSANTNNASDPDFSCIFNGPGPGFGSTWFSFAADTSSAVLDTSLSLGSTDTVVAVYSGDCGNLLEIGCGEDIDFDAGQFLTNLVVTGLTPGEVYLVQVSSFNEASAGEITLTLDNGPGFVECNGSGINTATLTSSDSPAIGETFMASVLPAGQGRLGISFAEAQFLHPLGEVLIDLNFVATPPTTDGNYNLLVPANAALVGQMIFLQAVAGDGTLTNSLKGVIGG